MVKFNFYLVDIAQKVVNNQAVLYLYGRTENNDSICFIDNSFNPYFWVLPKDTEKLKDKIEKLKTDDFEVTKVEIKKKKHLEKEYEFLKVFTNLPKSVPKVRNEIKRWDLVKDCFEYGKHVVGLSLDLVEQGKFGELEEKIRNKISQKFGEVSYDVKDILIGAADSLGFSLFLIDHILRAADIYQYLGNAEKAEKLIKLYNKTMHDRHEAMYSQNGYNI